MKRITITIVLIVGIFIVDQIVHLAPHEGAFWQHLPGGYGVFGLIVCLAIIFTAKGLGMGLLKEEKDEEW